MAPSRFTKVKIAIGYSLLLAILLFSLVFVHREMETLSASDDQQSLMTDSLLVLLREKDKNTIQMLRVLSEANDSLLSAREIEEIIAEQDSVVTQQRVAVLPQQYISEKISSELSVMFTLPIEICSQPVKVIIGWGI